jgi:hypothetical protein
MTESGNSWQVFEIRNAMLNVNALGFDVSLFDVEA